MSSPGGGGAEKMRIIQTILSAKSHYEVLGVAKDADEALLKSAYKKMVIKVHPDKIASLLDEGDKPKAEQAFRAVQNAYECLTVPRQRQIYDMQMESGGSGSSFVPGDTSSSEDDAAPSGGAFLLALLQICIALVLHVFVSLFNDGKAFFTAQALPLHIAIISIFTGWLGLGWGFFRVLFSCMGCYGLYRLVPQEQAWDLLKKGIAWQRRNCYSPEGQTLYFALACVLVLVYYREFGVVGAVSFGAMVWAVMLMAVILPQMTFNKHAGTIFFLFEVALVYSAAWDVHFSIFIAITAWHFMQGVPEGCTIVLLACASYLLYRASALIVILILAVMVIFGGGEYFEFILGLGALGACLTWWNYGFSTTLYSVALVYGFRRASNGQAMGKRLVVCTGMAWYWQPGFWNIVMCLVIFGVGSFLSAFAEVVKEETEQQSGDGQPHASTSSSSSPGGSSGPSGQSGGGGKKGRGKHR